MFFVGFYGLKKFLVDSGSAEDKRANIALVAVFILLAINFVLRAIDYDSIMKMARDDPTQREFGEAFAIMTAWIVGSIAVTSMGALVSGQLMDRRVSVK